MDPRGKVLAFALLVGLCAGCSSSVVHSTDGRTSPAAATSSTAPAASTGTLPGDEVLTPPPPDPGAHSQVAGFSAVPDGAFTGQLHLSLSGLANFDEKVTGSCTDMAIRPALAVQLTDGSRLRIAFDDERATTLLQAPGMDEKLLLDAVHTTVHGPAIGVTANLLAAGTSEKVGVLSLTGRCA